MFFVGCFLNERDDDQRDDDDPYQDEGEGVVPFFGLAVVPQACGAASAILKEIPWDASDTPCDEGREDDEIIQISKHGDEIGDQINGGEGVYNDHRRKDLGIPRGLFLL